MEGTDGDDFFSDDDFEDISANALLELEQNAIQVSQRNAASTYSDAREAYSHASRNAGEDDLTRKSTERHLPAHVDQAFQPSQDFGELNELDGGLVDDGNVITPKADETNTGQYFPGEATQREQWRLQRFAQPARSLPSGLNAQQAQTNALGRQAAKLIPCVGSVDDVEMEDAAVDEAPGPSGLHDSISALKAQLADLRRQNEDHLQALHTAQSTIQKQQGEIAIIRSKNEKATTVLDRQIAAIKKTWDEDKAKVRIQLEASNAEVARLNTENQFLKQDLNEEAGKVKGLQRNLKAKSSAVQEPTVTPKKNKSYSFRDGFDDDEIVAISPMKSGKKSKPVTPTAAGKRKRRATQDSPMPALQLSHSEEVSFEDAPQLTKNDSISKTPKKADKTDESFQFLQRILNYRIHPGPDRFIECLTKVAFPSDSAKPLSSILLEACAGLGSHGFPPRFVKLIASLWTQALREKYYRPLNHLIDIIKFILALDSARIAPHVLKDLVPVLQDTVRINGHPRFKRSPQQHTNIGPFKPTPKSELHLEIDTTACLEILYTLACSCLSTPDLTREFWETVEYEFTLMLLNTSQPISDLIINLNLLSTSVLPTSIGPINPAAADQRTIEDAIIDRVGWLLWELPRVDEGEDPCTEWDICELRTEALSFLSKLALSSPHPHNGPPSYASLHIANHSSAIAHLVRFMYDELDTLYSHTPAHELHAMLVNETTHLVYSILQTHGKDINMHEKLLAIKGGVQKHLIVMTRLTFSEGPLLEAGITDETVNMAHEMLENTVTPEEGDPLLELFPAHKVKNA